MRIRERLRRDLDDLQCVTLNAPNPNQSRRLATGALPRAFTSGGPAVCTGDGGEGEIPDLDAHAGVFHGVSGGFLLPDGHHFHLLLEVPPMAETGLSDEEFLKRLSAIYGEAFVAEVAKELADARTAVYTSESGMSEAVATIHKRFTYRMQDLGEFMKGLLQRFSQWFNRAHLRSGTLWEDRFKSVIVEDGVAARTISAYIDLNPVRAGMVNDPADYRWNSYGEAVGCGNKGNGKKAREGLVRAYFCDQGVDFNAGKWQEISRLYRRLMGFAISRKPGRAEVSQYAKGLGHTTKNTAELLESEVNETARKDLRTATMLRCRIRNFTDGAVIGSKEFVNEAFASARERFGKNRKDGARRLKGGGAATSGT